MAPDRIRDQLATAPFVPFTVKLPSGKEVRVQHPDYAFLSPAGRTLIVFEDPEDKRMEMLDVFLIEGLSIESGSESVSH